MRMNLVAFLVTFTIMNVCASAHAQSITLSEKQSSLKEVLNKIKKQSGFQFWYNKTDIQKAKPVTVNLKNVSLKEALDQCFEGQDLTYEIIGKTIAVKAKVEPAKEKRGGVLKKNITGKVTDEDGVGLAGVTVKVKGTNTQTQTSVKGDYSIEVGDGRPVLLFSSVGYQTQERAVLQDGTINIILSANSSVLDELKVIGYGTTTQRLTTGSVSKVSASEIERQPVSNPIIALQGRVPGLFITQTNGLPGGGINILIRGKNSISQGTLPLYIVDGVPFDSRNPTQLVATGSMNVNNPFNSINPGDIESIEVLKDADATSIYGSRGANGVILITTKKPRIGNLNVSMDTYTGWGRVARSLHLMDGQQFRDLRREALRNDGLPVDINTAPDLVVLDSNIVNDWQKMLIGGTAATTNIQLRMSGGSANTQFTAGANYNYQGTVFPGDYSNTRKGLNLAINHSSMDKKFTAAFTSSYAYTSSKLLTNDMTQYLAYPPYGFTPVDANGKLVYNEVSNYFGNPYMWLFSKYNGYTDLLNTSAALSYNILGDIKIKFNGGYNLIGYNEDSSFPISAQDPAQNPLGSAGFGHNTVRSWSAEPQLEYNRTFIDKLKVNVLGGASWQSMEGKKNLLSGSGYTSDALLSSISGASSITATTGYDLYHYNAIFGRASLNWDNQYLLNITARRDASSRFGPGKQFANFGSIGAGWIFSENKAFKSLLPVVTYGKLRFSYGTSGNDQIGNYAYLDSYTPATNLYQGSLSLQPTRLYNKNYSWEQFKKIDAALELGFVNDRFFLTVDYFRNRSDNQLVPYSLPTQTGFSTVLLNFPGKVQNSGWEIEARADILKSEQFRWSASANITIARNKLLSYPNLENSSSASLLVIGQSLSVIRGYEYLGVDPQTGIYTFKDQNGDGKLTTADYITLGNTDPKFYGGLQNTLRLGRLSLDFLFQFVKQTSRDPVLSQSNPIGAGNNLPTYVSNHWKTPGDQATYGKSGQTFGTAVYTSATNVFNSGGAFTDASYIRLKNASLNFNFPGKWLSSVRLKSLSVYLEGQNLLTITKYPGADPEMQSIYILPPLRVIATGIKATF